MLDEVGVLTALGSAAAALGLLALAYWLVLRRRQCPATLRRLRGRVSAVSGSARRPASLTLRTAMDATAEVHLDSATLAPGRLRVGDWITVDCYPGASRPSSPYRDPAGKSGLPVAFRVRRGTCPQPRWPAPAGAALCVAAVAALSVALIHGAGSGGRGCYCMPWRLQSPWVSTHIRRMVPAEEPPAWLSRRADGPSCELLFRFCREATLDLAGRGACTARWADCVVRAAERDREAERRLARASDPR